MIFPFPFSLSFLFFWLHRLHLPLFLNSRFNLNPRTFPTTCPLSSVSSPLCTVHYNVLHFLGLSHHFLSIISLYLETNPIYIHCHKVRSSSLVFVCSINFYLVKFWGNSIFRHIILTELGMAKAQILSKIFIKFRRSKLSF